LLSAYWSDIGVKCNVKTLEPGALYSTMYKKTHKQMLMMSRGSNTPTGEFKCCMPWNSWNSGMLDDAVFMAMFDDMTATVDVSKRDEMIKEINVYLIDQAFRIELPSAIITNFWWPWVKNYYGEYTVGYCRRTPILAQLWIDQDLKKEMGYSGGFPVAC